MTSKKPAKELLPKKSVKVTDDSGWTQVIRGRGKAQKAQASHPKFNGLQMPDKISLQELSKKHAGYVDSWKQSECWQNLLKILQENVLSNPRIRLTSCTCLGLGSLSAGKESSKHQMAALVSILQLLGQTYTMEKIIFQDPIFNDVDKAFLTGLGYRTVSTPVGFESIDQHAFCFAPHLEHEVFARALKQAHPALCIGNSDLLADRPLQSSAIDSKEDLDVFRSFVEASSSRKMPDFERDTWCQFTSIYWANHDIRQQVSVE